MAIGIDITYDIHAFAPDPAGGADDETLPPTRSREQQRTKAIRNRLSARGREQALPKVEAGLAHVGHRAEIRAEGERLQIGYDPSLDDYGFVRPEILVDLGARSTGEPWMIGCDAAVFLPDLSFLEVRPAAMLAERTFREKATSVHVFCLRQQGRGDRPPEHRHDVIRLDDAGIVDKVLSDHALTLAVACHEAVSFRETGSAIDTLAEDYAGMPANGLLPNDGEPFEALIKRRTDTEVRANRPSTGDGSVDRTDG